MPLKAAPAAAVYGWTGFYLGGHFGYGTGSFGPGANAEPLQGAFFPHSVTGMIVKPILVPRFCEIRRMPGYDLNRMTPNSKVKDNARSSLCAARFACHHFPRNDGAAMHWSVSIGAMLVAGVIAGAATSRPGSQLADTRDSRTAVDLELIIAVDVSYSMDLDELAVQREGYAQAIVSREFLQALKNGPNSKIAVTYFEWSASTDQKIIIPWRVIDGPETADAVANEIMKTPVRRGSRTSISGAITFAMPLFEENPYRGPRRVIDISGDGPNNNGVPVADVRAAALEKGITINGLPIMVK